MSYSIKNDKYSQKNNFRTILYLITVFAVLSLVDYLIYTNRNSIVTPLLSALNPEEFPIAIIGLLFLIVLVPIPFIVLGTILISLFKTVRYKTFPVKQAVKYIIFNDNDLNFIINC